MLAARTGYRLPYFWSDMTVDLAPGRISYRCRRRLPPGSGIRCVADVLLGAPLTEGERDELANFLTARFRLFSVIAGRLVAAGAEHPDWPLRRAELSPLDQTCCRARDYRHLP